MDIDMDMTRVSLVSERLILRPWQESDIDDFYEYARVEGVGEMAGWEHHSSIEESKKILKMFIEEKEVLALVDKKTKKVIGSLGLHYSWANDEEKYKNLKLKDIGYVLSKEYWGQGLVAEAVKTVIKFCFEDAGLDALTVEHFIGNNQSKRVIEKCGFSFVKEGEFITSQSKKSIKDMKYILIK